MNGWATVIVRCDECEHTWVTSLPIEWDGSLVACIHCGEFAGEVAEVGGK